MDLDDLRRLRRARDRMDREFADPITVPDLAAEALMSPGHFQRAFRRAYGETPHAHLMGRRVERAQHLLRTTELTVTEVCHLVGATSLGSFSAAFTRIVGCTPTAYRRADHSAIAQVPGCIARTALRPRAR